MIEKRIPKVVALVSYHGTHQGAFMAISATGKPITVMGINIFRSGSSSLVILWHMFLPMIYYARVPANYQEEERKNVNTTTAWDFRSSR